MRVVRRAATFGDQNYTFHSCLLIGVSTYAGPSAQTRPRPRSVVGKSHLLSLARADVGHRASYILSGRANRSMRAEAPRRAPDAAVACFAARPARGCLWRDGNRRGCVCVGWLPLQLQLRLRPRLRLQLAGQTHKRAPGPAGTHRKASHA